MVITSTTVISVLGALGGCGGLATVLTVLFQYRKYRAEAEQIHVANEKTKTENEIVEMDYIKNALYELHENMKAEMKESNEKLKAEIAELKENSKNLEHEIAVLNKKIGSLMNWITVDDYRYRSWLETKLHELDPSLEFPHLADPPDVYSDTFGENGDISD